MAGTEGAISFKRAREVLGVPVLAGQAEIRAAYHAAVKRVHPDRPGGDADAFREVVEAYGRLRDHGFGQRLNQPPAPMRPRRAASGVLEITPGVAVQGGEVEHALPDGRRLRITLPAGLRDGEALRAGEAQLTVTVRRDRALMLRGDDLWLSVQVDPALLAQGGRIAIDTPLGRRVVWITKQAGARGLVRLPGQGLPARAGRRQGHMFLRLAPQADLSDSAARTLLRRFAAAWAA
ncbi:DnaJ domain-containing protein [Phenylobacterium sp.]|jgi:curved DNA-binding protein|uniref:DnaJ domain-containing protein n=1 Tax=Phenylobacterium sp. TaxID=1871053 RepID=UPI002F4277A5